MHPKHIRDYIKTIDTCFLYIFNFKSQYLAGALERLKFSIRSVKEQRTQIIVSNNSKQCIYKDIKGLNNKIKYLHIPFDEPFNKPRCINFAVKKMIDTNYFFFSDIDLIYPNNYVDRMLKYVALNQEEPKIRVVPYNYNITVDKCSSDYNIVKGFPHRIGGFAHGNGLICTSTFMKIQGYNEFYVGYGPEDDDFNLRMGRFDKLIYDENITTFHLKHKIINRENVDRNMEYFKNIKSTLKSKDFVSMDIIKSNNNKPVWGVSPAVEKWVIDNGENTIRFDCNLDENSIVFDLGGYVGNWSGRIHNKYNCHLFIFEPVKEFYNKLVERFKFNKKVKIYNFGISHHNHNSMIYLNDDESSLHKGDNNKKRVEIVLKSLNDVIRDNNIKRIDLLKMNVEGEEYNIFKNIFNCNLITMIRNLQVQFHTFYPEAIERREEIVNKLNKTHRCIYNYDFVWEGWSLK